MPRLPLIEDNKDPRIAKIYEEVTGSGRGFPNLYRLLGHAPKMLQAWCDFAWPLRADATTPRALRELMILRGAQIMGADYEWVHHLEMARAAGVPQEKIDALADWRESDLFAPDERAALRLADEITHGPGASAEAMAEAQTHFDAGAIVELTLTSSFYACVGRMLHSIEVPLEA
ncbi:MAG: carboxymuconolactone decarboxylase family protein [Methylobacteriaceae bacterium]|nr:carboxymuconolactone decarboxylase family protein [Methylobacteriaceae bacterium]